MKLKLLSASIITTAALLVGCGGSSNNTPPPPPPPPPAAPDVINTDNVQKILETNADIALAGYEDSVSTAKALKTAIDAFAAARTQANLNAAKTAWLVSREPYGQTEVYRFRNSPIDDDPTTTEPEDGPEGDINAWPLGEALIDYVQTNSSDFGEDQVGTTANELGLGTGDGVVTGKEATPQNIIASTLEINEALISKTATAEDEHDVVAGYHALEFMLWGQDLNNANTVTDGTNRDSAVKSGPNAFTNGGQRPLTDFTTAAGADRRVLFLQVVVNKLIADLESVRDGWLDDVDGNYRDQFTKVADRADAIKKLTEILTGMGTLAQGELAGERMQIAYASNSQEDEHSCFSDNTHRDIWLNAEGIANSYYGVYAGYDSTLDGADDNTTRAVDGYGFDDYINDSGIDSLTTLKSAMEAALTATEAAYGEIDSMARNGSPVDVQIMDANRSNDSPMAKTILALDAESGEIAKLAEALDISDDVVDDDGTGCDTTNPGTACP